ncbi:T9SS type B sorting domain-containing protein [Ulvibacterium sp.]|uniref:T9SS type B sorting domain-containing protein n=1 Tax=Ulvibacterium sp. TaxID=2665914 RepID=UPI00262CD50B|nr:T9SS type B sorting domain-containing protein [Ulvibacterium sp.]
MNQKFSLKKKILPFYYFFLGALFYSSAQEAVPFSPRLDGGNIEIRGDIIFVGNNILNRASEANPSEANTPYNGSANNNSLWMEYIDIDSDPSTFSSSSAELNIADPSCSQVRYAGLYWAATYPNERSDSSQPFNGTPRIEDWFNIKFQIPGGTYVDLTADTAADPVGQEDDIIFDGYDYTNINNSFKDSPYICYKNVTDLVRSNTNPNGEYTVANVRATKGRRNGSSSAGWVMVVIYENPNESGKFISTFDGYAGLSGSVGNVDVAVNGFRTLPAPFPVRARIGVGSLEGDRGIRNDRFFIRANSVGAFTNLSTGLNPANNFFNSTITTNGLEVPTRTPYGTNTLGTDLDLFNLNNPNESVLPNDESGATLRFTSTGDGYGAFLATFSVEIIEPNIVLEKRVEDIGGNDITGMGVNLGQTLDYVLSFRNLGNDDATGYTIRDVLPVNTTFVSVDLSGAPGVTHSHDVATNAVTFNIPDNLVEIGDPVYTIRLRVTVAENCFDFVDACTDLIENLGYSTYRGDINSAIITDDPSVSDFDNCGFVTPGATNFLLDDLSDCNFTRTVELCGADVVLDAGDGFDAYIWVRDDNGNGQLDPTDTVLNDGDPDNDPSTFLVDDIGTYIVDKQVADPCKGFKEIITVERFGTTQTNPIVDYFNALNNDADPTNDVQGEIVQCSIDGDILPKIFLCGSNDSQLIQINITDAQSLIWEQLDEGSCAAAPDDCANKNLTCTWNQVATGNNFTANAEGKYRLVINYQNGCFSRFYFDVFQNNLDIQYNSSDIVCATDGNITITNLGNNYGYQLIDHANSAILVPFGTNTTGSFDFTSGQNGSYRVEVVQLDTAGDPIPGACIFSTPPIGILDRNFTVDIETTPANCNDQGTIKIDVLNVLPNYSYVLRRSDGTFIDDETAQPDNTHTFTVNPGDYIIETSTDDGCSDTQNVTVGRIPDPTLSALTTADIGCTAGTIELTRTGGQGNPDFLYAIWSKDGVDRYADIASIPADAYQVGSTFYFGWRDDDGDGTDEYIPNEDGTYEFIIIDANNCSAISNPVTINDNGTMTASVPAPIDVSCGGGSDGEINIVAVNGIPPYQYSIDGGTNFVTTASFVNLPVGNYDVVVQDDSGCEVTFTHTINEPFPLSASAGVSRDATCDPNGAEVRVTNVTGGTAPYQYSFDGGANYGATSIAVLPPGNYTVIVRDANNCTFPMAVTVDNEPMPPVVTLTPAVDYNCNGTGNITATPDIATYDYTYELDGVPNTPPTSNVFPNIGPGTYTVRTIYTSQTPPTPSLLLSEDFGAGATIPSPNTNGYNYEDQTNNPPGDANSNINDFEYSVTSDVVAPFGTWVSPIDHTTGTRASQGRYLVMNVGTPTPTQIIYSKEINDIVPNRDLTVSLYIMNLLRQGTSGLDPDLTIEIREVGTGNVVQSIRTGTISKNTGNTDWRFRTVDLNPGANTSLEFVIRSEISGNGGNDFALDDIEIFQIPEVCSQFVETPVTVVAGNIFAANVTASVNASCNGLSDGTITFEVENFDGTAGFDYSVDGGTNWINSTTSPVTTGAIFGVGTHRIDIRKADETTCTTFVEETITEPSSVVANASITTVLTCTNGGATITASASGGTPNYVYQLEDTGGVVVGGFDFATNTTNTVFSGLAAGDYIVRARDANNCEDAIDTALTVAPTNNVVFNLTPTACYSGSNDATIQVDVTDGNGNYQFSINSGPWLTPSPTTATTYTFQNLANGTYTVDVQDGFGCVGVQQSITIDPQLTVTASAPNITACGTDTDITISASGGDTNFVYAVVTNGTVVADGDFGPANTVTVTAAGAYDIYVRDNNGNPGYCTAMHPLTVVQDPALNITATPTAVSCFGGTDGAISIVVNSGGSAPFTYSIDGGTTYVPGSSFPNLAAGTYPVRVRDANGCETPINNTVVTEPTQLTGEATVTQNYTCAQLGQITVGNVTATSGGSGDYQYSINGGAWTTTTTGGHTFIDLTDGTYSIRVRDANAISCEITLPDVTINPLPTEPVLSTSISYNCDGSGNITVTPFDASYTYILNGVLPGQTGAGSNVFNNVAVGSHTITVDYGSSCSVDTSVIVANGNAFEASVIAFDNLDCNLDGSGTITISANNFGAGGYEYNLNGGAFVGPFTTDEQITGLSAQAYTIVVRDVDNPIAGCSVTLNQTLTEPTQITASASITEPLTCDNGGATITASASGGTPTYVYQLEDNTGTVIGSYDFATNGANTVFSGLAAGDYIVRARDINNCEDAINTALTVVGTTAVTFNLTPTPCYLGDNNASIQVDITAGNGNYELSINGGPWVAPPSVNATTHLFENLTNGSYTINVRDAYGCIGTPQNLTINPAITATVDVVDISSCANGSITVNASGGDGNLVYAFVSNGTPVTSGDFGPGNTYTVTTGNDGMYDVYVWDNNAANPHCEFLETVTVDPAVPLTFTATPTDPDCYDGTGSIAVSITSGEGPYTIEIIDLDNGGASNQTDTNVVTTNQTYFNLAPGDYTINVTDANGCLVADTPISINNPDELTATVQGIVPGNCTGNINDFGIEFSGYPTTLGTIQFSADGGTSWPADNSVPGTSDQITGFNPGDTVFPSLRTIDGSSNTVCQTDLPPFIIPYPLDDLDINVIPIVIDCNTLEVAVQGTAGLPGYEYAYSEDPANFDPTTAVWQPGGTLDTSNNPVPAGHGRYTWTGLVPGRTYVFYVRDSSGPPACVRQSSVNVNVEAPPPVQIDAAVTPTCDGQTNGQITFTVTETTPGELGGSFNWELFLVGTPAHTSIATGSVPAFTTGDSFAAPSTAILAPGEYFVEITGPAPNNCVIGSENVLVEELDPITGTPNVLTHITCANPGLVEIQSVFGGGGTYTYTLTSTNFVSDIITTDNPVEVPISNLVDATATPFNVDVSVTDQYGCSNALGTVSMNISQNPSITGIATSNCTIPFSVSISASGGTAPYLYSIDGGTSYISNGGVFTNVTPGTYNVAIIDSNGCTDTDTIDVHPVLEADVDLSKLLDCTGTPDAQITIDVTSGSGSYDYQITDSGGTVVARAVLPSNPFVFNTTAPEDYVITIYDNNTSGPECSRVFPITVEPAVIPAFTETHTDVSCNGASDGTITLTETPNGINPLTYTIAPVAGSFNAATQTFENLPDGTYTVTGTGTNNCTFDISGIIIGEPAPISITLNPVVEFACTSGNNPNNASISINAVNGGSTSYVRYEFINNQGTVGTGDDVVVQDGTNTSYVETDINGGSYIINVYDDNGCVGSTTATIAPFVEISNPIANITQNITCNPGNDAEVTLGITLNPLAATPNLEYSVVGTDNAYSVLNQPTNVFTALGVGNYAATVTNTDTGCFVQTAFEIEDPNNFEIVPTTVDVICFGTDGSVSFTVNDPVNPYMGGFTWQIYDSQGTSTLADDTIIAGANGTSLNAGPTTPFNIGAGEYRVEITQTADPNCVGNEFFTIAGPSATITANTDVTPITCVGNDGVIEIIDVLGGWGGYSYYVGTSAPTGAGDYGVNRRFENLPPGTYEAWVLDANSCPQRVQNSIVLADPTPISASLQINQPNCTDFEGEIEIVSVANGQGSNYTYQLIKNGTPTGTLQNTRVFSGLDAGSYQVQVTDQWTCTFTTTPVVLFAPIVPQATIVKTRDCSVSPEGEITITQTGGSGNFDYDVTYPDGFTTDNNTTGVFTGLNQTGDYTFTITDQTVGHACSTTITQRLEDPVLPLPVIDTFTNVTCNGADDGTISVSVVDNGVGPYVFQITALNGAPLGTPINPTTNTNFTAIFTGLQGTSGGNDYTITATAANDCSASVNQSITQPDAIVVNAIVPVPYGCTTGNNTDHATLTFVGATGGTTNFVRFEFVRNGSVVQDGTNTTYTETDLAGGNYDINVYDENGCLGTTTATILPFEGISNPVVNTTVDVTCNPGDDAQIEVGVTVNPGTATPNFEYTVTGINVVYNHTIASTNNPETFTGLGVGNYSVSITNLDTGCALETVHTIEDPDIIEVIATKLTDEECLNNGVDDGSFAVAINNYTGNYDYQVYDVNDNPVAGFAGSGNGAVPLAPISNLPEGVYYIRITETEAPFCVEDSNRITITAPDAPITATITEETSVSCSNDHGSILVDPEGGIGPYTITITSPSQTFTQTGVEAYIFPGLAAGTFSVSIADTMSCLYTDAITLIRPDDIVATIANTPLTCFNENTASVTALVNVRNVTPVYEYRLNRYDDLAGSNLLQTSSAQASQTFGGLSAGFYSVTVTDDVGCSVETSIVEIINPVEVEAFLVRTDPLTCITGVEFELSATGGGGTYEYSADNVTFIPMAGNSINLPQSGVFGAGTYQYYVRDAVNGCVSVASNEIEEDPIIPLTLILDQSAAYINCNGESTASIYADADGGLGNYRYELYSNYNGTALNLADRIDGPRPDGEFTGLGVGTYWVNVTSGDCTAEPQQVNITEPTPLTYTESVVDVSCFGEDDGTITVTLSGGAGGYQYAISPNLNQFDTVNTFADLAPGTYTVIAQDQNGCFEQLEYTISEPTLLEVTAVATPEVCAGDMNGIIDLTIQGGTAPYSSRLSSEVNFTSDQSSITGLAAGGYIVFVRDANGCEANVSITVDAGANLNAAVEPVYECTGDTPNNYVNITLEDSSVLGDILYAMDSTDPLDMQLNPDFRDIAPGSHYIAIAHANGCLRTIDFEIEGFEPLTLALEQNNINEITALADGGLENYTFYFGDVDNGTDNTFYINRTDTYTVTVVDENGCEAVADIFMEFIDIEIPNFFTPDGDGLNDFWTPRNQEAFPQILTIIFDRYGREVYRMGLNDDPWDGIYQQSELPTGDYWYVIKLRGESDDREFIGHFTLYR